MTQAKVNESPIPINILHLKAFNDAEDDDEKKQKKTGLCERLLPLAGKRAN